MAYYEKAEDETELPAEAGWNMARGFIQEIQNSLQSATRNYNHDMYFEAFKNLHSVRMRIVQYLSTEESKKFRTLTVKIRNLLGRYTCIEEPEDHRAEYCKLTNEIFVAYEEYNDYLMLLLKKYKLGIPDKEIDEGLF